MKKIPHGLAVIAATALFLAGCAPAAEIPAASENDQDPPVAADEDSTETGETGDDSPEDADFGEVLGVVKINDFTTYAITELRNCEPLNDGTIERELELQGFGEHEGTPIQIDVYKQMVAGSAGNEVSWSGPEGVFGSSDIASITWAGEGDNVLGSSTLVDGATQSEKIMVGFDLQVPAETVACR
ncbi:hypothetical protein [Microbacterium suaedae]|uniref:hypothetical protein n=1 Tax=Microbacterium suaedae TaxID=2067813 RepID=UPI000DA2412E|nr:hypothetical protein [Microbacterium suaedae]